MAAGKVLRQPAARNVGAAGCSPRPQKTGGQTRSRRARNSADKESLPAVWQSLADWHRELAASPESHRLHIWQLDVYRGASHPSSALPTCVSRASGSASRCSRQLPTRPHSVASAAPSATKVQQPPYPQLPRSPLRDPACVRSKGGRARAAGRSLIGRCRKWSPCEKPLQQDTGEVAPNTGGTRWWSASIDDEAFGSLQESSSTVKDKMATASVSQALGELSRGILRSHWHLENLAREAGQGHASSQEPPLSGSEAGLVDPDDQPTAPPKTTTEALPPPRRLEVVLRGTFRTEALAANGSSDATEDVEDEEALADVNPRPVTSNSLKHSAEAEDGLRARMGFGRDEAGATPSGRSSVPAVRGGPSGGALSAPPFAAIIDEGIELSSLASSVEHQVIRILERSMRGSSRAASCEPLECFRSSPCMSPPPMFSGSPQTSLCRSPSPKGVGEELNVCVSLRLCQSRCGPSSAFLELILDHCQECSEASGCRCWPTPRDAESRLLSYFSRHSLLRLTAARPPLRVSLESLNNDETAENP